MPRNANRLIYLPLIAFFLFSMDRIWVTEDAFITFRSVENLWRGHGPVFNAGFRVESFTHPLWFFYLSVLRIAGSIHLPLLAALSGIVFSCTGLTLSISAARQVLTERSQTDEPLRLFPAGALIVSSIPVFWDFASSGLETGLSFFWIGACAYLLMKNRNATSAGSFFAKAACISLGPLIRPDFIIFWFFYICVLMTHSVKLPRFARLAFVALGSTFIPGLYQVFRMGYFAAWTPNTAIAKEGLGAHWHQGFSYALDFIATYQLWIPLSAVGIWIVLSIGAKTWTFDRLSFFRMVMIAAAAILHMTAIIRLGGDFMHGRLLLPGFFALCSVFSVLPPLPRIRIQRILTTALIGWSICCSMFMFSPFSISTGSRKIADERSWYIHRSLTQRPIYAADYRIHVFYRQGELAAMNPDLLQKKAFYWAHIGISASIFPHDKTLIDPLGLNDHISSRMQLIVRGRPGHEKIAPAAWFLARFPDDSGFVFQNQLDGAFLRPAPEDEIEAARRVLASSEIQELNAAVSGELTPARFLDNILKSWRFTQLRIPPDPIEAVKRFSE